LQAYIWCVRVFKLGSYAPGLQACFELCSAIRAWLAWALSPGMKDTRIIWKLAEPNGDTVDVHLCIGGAEMTLLKRLKQHNRNSFKGEQLTYPKMEIVNTMTSIERNLSSLVFRLSGFVKQVNFLCWLQSFR